CFGFHVVVRRRRSGVVYRCGRGCGGGGAVGSGGALNSATVEILRDLGLAGRIGAVENGGERVLRSDPRTAETAAVVKSLGHPFNPDVAAIVALRPDLVISAEENLKPPAIEALRAANVPLLMLEHSAKDGIDGLKRRIGTIARVFGAEKKGRALVEE